MRSNTHRMKSAWNSYSSVSSRTSASCCGSSSVLSTICCSCSLEIRAGTIVRSCSTVSTMPSSVEPSTGSLNISRRLSSVRLSGCATRPNALSIASWTVRSPDSTAPSCRSSSSPSGFSDLAGASLPLARSAGLLRRPSSRRTKPCPSLLIEEPSVVDAAAVFRAPLVIGKGGTAEVRERSVGLFLLLQHEHRVGERHEAVGVLGQVSAHGRPAGRRGLVLPHDGLQLVEELLQLLVAVLGRVRQALDVDADTLALEPLYQQLAHGRVIDRQPILDIGRALDLAALRLHVLLPIVDRP